MSRKADLTRVAKAKQNVERLLDEPDNFTPRTNNVLVSTGSNIKSYKTYRIIIEDEADKNGLCWVYVLLDATKLIEGVKTRLRKKFNTGQQVAPKHWDSEERQIKGKSDGAFQKNNNINTFHTSLDKKIIELSSGRYVELEGELKVLADIFGHGIKKNKAKGKGLVSYIDDYVEYRKGQGTGRGTYKVFITLKNRLEAYEKENGTIYLQDINLTLSDNLTAYWGKLYHPNTIKKAFEVLVTVLNHFYARKEEMHIELNDKFRTKEFGNVPEYEQPPIALSQNEIEVIQKFNFNNYHQQELKKLDKQIKKDKIENKREFLVDGLKQRIETLELTRDRALLQIGTGLRVSDLFNLNPNSVDDQKKHIKIRPKKTLKTKSNNQIIIPLFDIAKEVLKKYDYNTSKKPFKVASQNYNKSIKDLLEIVGINEEIELVEFKNYEAKTVYKKKFEVMTSHNFRDTFITMAVRKNIPIPQILKWTGQSSYQVMKKYINLTEQETAKTEIDLFKN